MKHGESAHADATIGYAGLLQELDGAIAWLTALGAEPGADSRYTEYRASVAELVNEYQKPNWRPNEATLDRLYGALYEASDLLTIQTGLRGGDEIAGLTDRLRDLVQGPARVTDEELIDGGIHARNVGFELVVAARLKSSGYPPRLDERGDVVFALGDQRVVTECKRPRRSETVVRCLEQARQQALNDIGDLDAANSSALIAIEATVVVHPNRGLLITPRPLRETLTELSDRMARAIAHDMENLWHRRILGAMVRFSALVSAGGIPIYAQQWAFVRNAGADLHRRELAEQLSTDLQRPAAMQGLLAAEVNRI